MSETVLLFQGKYYDVGTKVKFIRKYQWNSVTEGTIIWIEPNSITIKTYNDINYNIFVSDVDRMIKEIIEPIYYTGSVQPPIQPSASGTDVLYKGVEANKNRNYPSEGDIEVGWIWYIIIMLVGAIFKDRWIIWVVATFYFFSWKNGFLGGKK